MLTASENMCRKPYGPPPETFQQDANNMVRLLLEDAEDDPSLALYKLLFYIERAEKNNLKNKEQLSLARTELEKIVASDLTC